MRGAPGCRGSGPHGPGGAEGAANPASKRLAGVRRAGLASTARDMRADLRTWVLRAGRMTAGQKRAIDRHWPRFGLGPPPEPRVAPVQGPPIDPAAVFGRRAPLVVEIGFGRGDVLLEAAAARPDRDYVGIEVHAPGIGYLLARVHEHGLENVRVLFGGCPRSAPAPLPGVLAGRDPDLLPRPLAQGAASQAPPRAARVRRPRRVASAAGGVDPRRHRRRGLRPSHAVRLRGLPRLENLAGPGAFWSGPTGRTRTRFEERGRRRGSGIRDLRFERTATA